MFDRGPPEILPPGTLSKSQGTKFLGSKFFFYHKNKMLFYDIFGFVGQNLKFYEKNMQILPFFMVMVQMSQNDSVLA